VVSFGNLRRVRR